MGVTGLWEIVKPCARPIKIETLNRKRLAVDASIWIYQFLKAVRDKEGNALRNSHVVGFFRRICKLLFFGIKPVFVFDGGAPVLKRQTVMGRKQRREGRREDAARTAGRLLAVQMQRRAELDEQKRKDDEADHREGRRHNVEEEAPEEELVYVDELHMTQQERQQHRKFKKTDQYHLPDLDVSMTEMGGPNDPRVMSLEDLQAYARQFETGEDINVYDFSKIDYDSAFFTSLPASDRYNILNAARLRSRLRMGHSKEQLDNMFPDRMAFSKFQIERVTERNELTQRLMNINDPNGEAEFGLNGAGRVAGEKGREYVLVKNDGVEGGWALGVVTNEGERERPIDVDKPAPVVKLDEDEESGEDDGFEDVPIQGLNRLPKPPQVHAFKDDFTRQRQALYKSRRQGATSRPKRAPKRDNRNSLFVAEKSASEAEEEDWEDGDAHGDLFGEEFPAEEDEELRRAITMSLEKDGQSSPNGSGSEPARDSDNDMLDVFQQTAAEEARPVPQGSARAIANVLNKRAFNTAPESRETTSFGVPVPRQDDSDSDDALDLQAALAEARRGKRRFASPPRRLPAPSKPKPADAAADMARKAGFSGPLPFEKLDLGTSLLGKKKMQDRTEDAAGGFLNPELEAAEKKKSNEPLPPWFNGDLEKDIERQKAFERTEREKDLEHQRRLFQFQSRGGDEVLGTGGEKEIIDLEGDDDEDGEQTVIDLEKEEPEVVDIDAREEEIEEQRDDVTRMGDMAEVVRVEPPRSALGDQREGDQSGPFDVYDSDTDEVGSGAAGMRNAGQQMLGVEPLQHVPNSPVPPHTEKGNEDDKEIEWSESNGGQERETATTSAQLVEPAGGHLRKAHSLPPTSPVAQEHNSADRQNRRTRSPSVDFEDVGISNLDDSGPTPASGAVQQDDSIPDDLEGEFEDFSDPEEEAMLEALTLEAEEHARFASSLNNKSQAQNIAEYEKELKQLRNQQKKDRRDADEVTHVMITECQQLLRLFGLPYVTAPMEAEAQCAELVKLGLVDGIVTDDSDCFLFGGTRVYKNMFNQAKFVECYLTSDLEKEFDLTRDKLIQVAHLLGSDYTEGLQGVGHVTALEILGEFRSLDEFKTWLDGVQMQQITKEHDKDNIFRRKFRKKATKLILPPNFPDVRVDIAYQQPDVDSDPQPFQWGVPDLDALRNFLMSTVGWSSERTDEVLVPVIRDMNRRMDEGTQSNITAFFEGGIGVGAAGAREGFAPRKKVEGSKRMGDALGKMAARAKRKGRSEGAVQEGEGDGFAAHAEDHGDSTAGKKRKIRGASAETNQGGGEGSEDEASKRKKRTKKSGQKQPSKSASGRRRGAQQMDDE